MKLFLGLMFFSISALAAIQDSASTVFSTEYAKARNEALPMGQRWKALQKASEVATGEEFSKIVAFGNSRDWFMRNASLVALDKAGNDMVYDQAKKLIQDKALVVRSASVDILARLKNNSMKKIFSQELEKKYNFNGQSSLWIRKQMMSYLVRNPEKSEKDFFLKYLYDKDIEVAALSTQALEKITDIRLTGKNQTDLVQQWKKVAQNQKW